MFTVGIGPSSSHTVGPMRAAGMFVDHLTAAGLIGEANRIRVVLRGSLGATGVGHGTPDAVVAGLLGWAPETCDPDRVHGLWAALQEYPFIEVKGHSIRVEHADVELAPTLPHPEHPNALDVIALGADGRTIAERCYLSVGGGFVVTQGQQAAETSAVPIPYTSYDDLVATCNEMGLTVAQVVARNEVALGADPREDALAIWAEMSACIRNGCTRTEDALPGGLLVRRRAPTLARTVDTGTEDGLSEWISRIQLAALAVNEENASGHRVVTAPTNGAAGIMPAVIDHYTRLPGSTPDGVVDMLLTATAIGGIIKSGASISGAEVGCQGEVGSACAMAAGALCAVLGGTPEQVGKAAEMGLEHHLGLTCDPVGGLVQIPCIERNAIAAVTAVQAAILTLREGISEHHVSLDTVIRTMARVGADMHDKYKETSLGGLAVSVPEC